MLKCIFDGIILERTIDERSEDRSTKQRTIGKKIHYCNVIFEMFSNFLASIFVVHFFSDFRIFFFIKIPALLVIISVTS